MTHQRLPPRLNDSELPAANESALPEWLETNQVARMLKISPSSLEKARSTGRGTYAALTYHKLGRSVRYRRADIEQFLTTAKVIGASRR